MNKRSLKRIISDPVEKVRIADAKRQGRKGLVLTCKEALIPYYAKSAATFYCGGSPDFYSYV